MSRSRWVLTLTTQQICAVRHRRNRRSRRAVGGAEEGQKELSVQVIIFDLSIEQSDNSKGASMPQISHCSVISSPCSSKSALGLQIMTIGKCIGCFASRSAGCGGREDLRIGPDLWVGEERREHYGLGTDRVTLIVVESRARPSLRPRRVGGWGSAAVPTIVRASSPNICTFQEPHSELLLQPHPLSLQARRIIHHTQCHRTPRLSATSAAGEAHMM
jgi:hypothetical protein